MPLYTSTKKHAFICIRQLGLMGNLKLFAQMIDSLQIYLYVDQNRTHYEPGLTFDYLSVSKVMPSLSIISDFGGKLVS